LTLRRYRKTVLPRDEGDDWGLTESDLFAIVPGAAPSTRVLGVLSRHAIEISLEEVGILDRIRERGFTDPHVEVAVGGDTGETIRLFGDERRDLLLMELRLTRNRRLVPGLEVLYIEWLLLQDPRAAFTHLQPRLPGQSHPGLGLLREVIAWIVLLCERLGLDGLASTPAQYYMAVLGHNHVEFVDGAARARFAALFHTLRGLSLVEAERALAEGRVVDEAGSVIRWEPSVTVFPVSPRLRSRLEAEADHPRPTYRLRPPPGAVDRV
jgi:hypothetical protein